GRGGAGGGGRHGGPAPDGLPPAGDAGKVGEDLPTLELRAGQIRRVGEPPLGDTEETVRVVAEPLDGVGALRWGVSGWPSASTADCPSVRVLQNGRAGLQQGL